MVLLPHWSTCFIMTSPPRCKRLTSGSNMQNKKMVSDRFNRMGQHANDVMSDHPFAASAVFSLCLIHWWFIAKVAIDSKMLSEHRQQLTTSSPQSTTCQVTELKSDSRDVLCFLMETQQPCSWLFFLVWFKFDILLLSSIFYFISSATYKILLTMRHIANILCGPVHLS